MLRKIKKGAWAGLEVLPKVDNLMDVGIGPEGTPGLYEYFPSSRKIMIDPLVESKDAIEQEIKKNSENIFLCLALASRREVVEIHVRHPLSRSGLFLKPNEIDATLEKRKVKVETLDYVISKLNLKGTVALKIDTEGSELEILKGASELLKVLSWVILELPIGRVRFESTFSFEEAISFMGKQNFFVVGIRVSGDGTDHCDVAFLRSDLVQ